MIRFRRLSYYRSPVGSGIDGCEINRPSLYRVVQVVLAREVKLLVGFLANEVEGFRKHFGESRLFR